MTAISPQILQYAMIGFGAASSTIGGIAQWKQGSAQQAAYEYNAAATIENMKQEMSKSEREFSSLMGRQRALYAQAGVDLASGSPLLVLADTAMQESIESQRIKKAGETQAELQRFYGRQAAYAGKVGGLNTFLTGLGTAATQWYQMNPPKAPKGPGSAHSPLVMDF